MRFTVNSQGFSAQWTVMLAALLALLLAACGGNAPAATTAPTSAASDTTAVSDTAGEDTTAAAAESTIALDETVTREIDTGDTVTFQFPSDWVVVEGDTLTTFAYNEPGVDSRTTRMEPGDIYIQFARNNGSIAETPQEQVTNLARFMDGIEFSEPEVWELDGREGATMYGTNSMCGGCMTQPIVLKNEDGTYTELTAFMHPDSFEAYQPFLKALMPTITYTPAS